MGTLICFMLFAIVCLILLYLKFGILGILIGISYYFLSIYLVIKHTKKVSKSDFKSQEKAGTQTFFLLFILFLVPSILVPIIPNDDSKNYDDEITYSESVDETSNTYATDADTLVYPTGGIDEPYVGMETRYIDKTKWGAPFKKEVTQHLRGSFTTYTWYLCKDDRQYYRTVDVDLKVFYVSPPDQGVKISELNSDDNHCQ